MAKRGPKPKFKPFQKTVGGNFYLYVPQQGILSLETDDPILADTKSRSYAEQYNAAKNYTTNVEKVTTPVLSPPQPKLERMAGRITGRTTIVRSTSTTFQRAASPFCWDG